MYGDWQLGHIPLEDYVKKHNEFADAMRAVDPSIQIVGVGATGPWSKTMLEQCGDHMNLLSEHFYCQGKPGVMSHVRQIPDNVATKAREHRKYHQEIPALAGKLIPIALDEWNYWYGPDLYGEIGTRYFLKDALGIAAGFHEMYRNSDVFFMANYAQTVNVIGAIKTSKTDAQFDTTGLVLKLYRQRFGTIPVAVSGDVTPLDVMAAWREDRKALTVGLVNATRQPQYLTIAVTGAELTGKGKAGVIEGTDPLAYNEPGQPPAVTIVDRNITLDNGKLPIPPLCTAVVELEVK